MDEKNKELKEHEDVFTKKDIEELRADLERRFWRVINEYPYKNIELTGEITKVNDAVYGPYKFGTLTSNGVEIGIRYDKDWGFTLGQNGTFRGELGCSFIKKTTTNAVRLNVKEFEALKQKIKPILNKKNIEFPTGRDGKWKVCILSNVGDGYEDAKVILDKSPFVEYECVSCDLTEPKEIAEKFVLIDSCDFDVILIVRGGNTLLSVFNDEEIYRVVENRETYTVSGIGHVSSVTYTDEVADKYFDVPSQAASWLVSAIEDLMLDTSFGTKSKELVTSQPANIVKVEDKLDTETSAVKNKPKTDEFDFDDLFVGNGEGENRDSLVPIVIGVFLAASIIGIVMWFFF